MVMLLALAFTHRFTAIGAGLLLALGLLPLLGERGGFALSERVLSFSH